MWARKEIFTNSDRLRPSLRHNVTVQISLPPTPSTLVKTKNWFAENVLYCSTRTVYRLQGYKHQGQSGTFKGCVLILEDFTVYTVYNFKKPESAIFLLYAHIVFCMFSYEEMFLLVYVYN